MPHNTEPKHEQALKAGALLCPVCCVEYVEVGVDFDVEGTILREVKVLRCPICQDEQFTAEQQQQIKEILRTQPKKRRVNFSST